MYPSNRTVYNIDTDSHHNNHDIRYGFNEYGFRSDSFTKPSQINILTSGCSLTIGVGVNENWTQKLKHKIQQHTSQTVTAWNIATSGASCDYTVRSIYKVFNKLEPDYTFVYWPPITRLEIPLNKHVRTVEQLFLKESTVVPVAGKIPDRFTTEEYFQMSFNKNNILLHLLEPNVFDNDTDVYFDSYSRDGQHPNEEWHERVAEMYFQQYLTK